MSAAVAIVLVAAMGRVALARSTPSLDGTWGGTVDVGTGRPPGIASGALAQSGRGVKGSLTLDAGTASGVFSVTGTLRGKHAVLTGKHGARRLRWKARYDPKTQSWRGPMVQRTGAGELHGKLVLARNQARGPVCGGDYFASVVMPRVIDPICSQCHVPGGLAQAAPFKVTPGNPAATAASALHEVNPADPTHSKLVEKPLGNLGHGGGQRIQPGSPEEQILLHWIALVTAPGCDLGGPGGGGGSGGTGADLYAANCASCHGADASGLDGRPDIRCNRDVGDAVRNGRSGPAGVMPAFANLADADIAQIQAFLDGLCPVATVTGASLFTSNCATCHGADATRTATAPSVRCATRAADAMRIGRGAAMPAFPAITDPEVALVDAFLTGLCDQSGRPAADLFAGNCSTCHGATAAGGRNGLGVAGPDIRCSRGIAEPVASGQGTDMPAFPRLTPADVTSLQQFLTDTFCPASGATGVDLYTSNCASCHGADANGVDGTPGIRCNRSIHDVVLSGRTGPSGTMPGFVMTDAEIALVQAYLVGLCPIGSTGGADLFASNCLSCHGIDATGSATAPSVRCATRVVDAVQYGRGERMPSFPTLAPSEVAALQTWLDGLCTASGRQAPDLYAGNCSTCHGAGATGGQNGLGVSGPDIHCNREIAAPVASGQGTDMPAFPALGGSDVTSLQQYLVTTFCPVGTATGADLYASNCASCHGMEAAGTDAAPSVRCATLVADAMREGRGPRMPSFPAFVPTEVSSVQSYLTGICNAHGRPGSDLYLGNCSTCHGTTARGGQNGLGVHGPDIQCTPAGDYSEKVRFGDDSMPAFPALGAGDITAIVDYVHGAFCTGG